MSLAVVGEEPAAHTTPAFDQVVLAVPPTALNSTTDLEALGPPTDLAEQLGSSPIVNLHLVRNRPVLTSRFVAGVDSPMQSVFDRAASSRLSQGQYLPISLSDSDTFTGTVVAQLRKWAMPHLRALLPGTHDTVVRGFFLTREPGATLPPGTVVLRPPAGTPAAGLVLAGAWTGTGWPATMEGAVRSGHTAPAILNPAADSGHSQETAA